MSKGEVGIVIVAVVIIVVYAIYIVIAYQQNWFPFGTYVSEVPEDGFIVNPETRPLTTEEQAQAKDKAAYLCAYLANTENYMTIYCGQPPSISMPSCDKITE